MTRRPGCSIATVCSNAHTAACTGSTAVSAGVGAVAPAVATTSFVPAVCGLASHCCTLVSTSLVMVCRSRTTSPVPVETGSTSTSGQLSTADRSG